MARTWAAALIGSCLTLALHPAFSYAQEQQVKVANLDITGIQHVGEETLRSALATRESSWLPWGDEYYFNRSQFEADLKRIAAFYADRGFPDAKVASFDLDLNEAQDEISISIAVDEGEPVIVEDVRFEGADVLPADHARRLVRQSALQPGEPRDRAEVEVLRERLLDELRDHGYPYAQVRVSERAGSAERGVVLTYAATPGIVAYFGPIEIAGNTSVADDVIRRHLLFRPGERFRLGLVQQSQRRLYGLELFEFVNVERVEGADRGNTPPAEVPIRITVTEGDHRKLDFGVGWGTEEKLRAEANWRHVNFFGGARTATVEGRWSSLDRGVRTSLRQPYFFSPRVSVNLSGEAWRAREPAYDLDTAGARVTFQRRFTSGGPLSTTPLVSTLSAGVIHHYEDYAISNEALADLSFRDTLIALGLDPRTGTAQGLLAALDFDYSRNTTGNLLDAKSGYVLNARLQEAGKWLWGDFDFREVVVEGRHYLNVADRFVIANRLQLGTLAGPDDVPGAVPFFKFYFLGGSSSLRGWGRFEVSPLSGSGLPIGGRSMLEASSEVRVPVWGKLGLVLFVDAGNVWEDQWTFKPGKLLVDVGPGLRYHTPIGPVRFDFGYQVNRLEGLLVEGEPEPRRFRMHFSIGQAF
jgi:outer membrane protein assembly complex protein YaeT